MSDEKRAPNAGELHGKNNRPTKIRPGHDVQKIADGGSDAQVETPSETPVRSNKFRRILHGYLTHKKITIPLTVLLLVAILAAAPATRFALAGTVLKQNYVVSVIDDTTNKPVTSATVSLAGSTVQTDKDGHAHLKVKVGPHAITVQKKYFKSATLNVTVPIMKQKGTTTIKMTATGRQVPLRVINRINGEVMENVTITAAGTEVKTDKNGEATIVLPADISTLDATLSTTGFNDAKVTIKVTEQVDLSNTFRMVASGKVYFLSKLSGKIDVVKTNLDGTERATVLAGTGQEDQLGTVLLASRDWKYVMLLSRRDGTLAKLYLIDTSTDKLTTVDEGNASFTLTGWSNHSFIYTVYRNDVQNWQPKQQALKSYNADSSKLSILDETEAVGSESDDYATERFTDVFALSDTIIYTVDWNSYYNTPALLQDKRTQIISNAPDGSKKTILKSLGMPAGVSSSELAFGARLYEAQGVYFQFNQGNDGSQGNEFFKYEDGVLSEDTALSQDNFYSTNYLTYLTSPSGKETFWSEPRDGKNSLFTGDANGEHPVSVYTPTDLQQYGWYSDKYLLLSKNGSELYIMARAGNDPIKITDYHKPAVSYRGYGGGYGGY